MMLATPKGEATPQIRREISTRTVISHQPAQAIASSAVIRGVQTARCAAVKY
jgi:hypothetical protein